MALPTVPLARETLTIEGHSFELRQLSYGEVLRITTIEDEREVQVFALSCALGESQEDISSWIDQTPPGTVKELSEKVADMSALREEADRPTSGT